MKEQEVMTDILSKMMSMTDPDCLQKIQDTAYSRKCEVRQFTADLNTADWKVGDKVQLTPENRSRKPYGAIGTIKKINKVRMKVDFGNYMLYTVPKSMLMKAEG